MASKVSVIVPVYNVAKYLRQCMDSLVGQTLREIEIICVDDGSTDGSGAILDEYAGRDPRVKVVHQANAGAGPARNAGLAVATGEYLFFCDPDDWCGRRMLERMQTRASRRRADVLIAAVYECDSETGNVTGVRRAGRWPNGAFDGARVGAQLFRLSRHTVWDKLFRRAFVLENGISFQDVRRFNDMLFCDLALACAQRISTVRYPGYRHRMERAGGLQSGRVKTPEMVLEVYDALRDGLKARGLFDRYREAYVRAFFFQSLHLMFLIPGTRDYAAYYEAFVRRLRPYWPVSVRHVANPVSREMAEAFDPDLPAADYALAVARILSRRQREFGVPKMSRLLPALARKLVPHWLKARL